MLFVRKFSLSFLAGALLLSGCAVGPDYVAPEIATPATFSATNASLAADPVEIQWWRLFDDPELQSLIDRAIVENKDVKIAQARLEESREMLSEARFNYYPTIRSSGDYEYSKINTPQTSRFPGGNFQGEAYRVGFDATWELDIFGRVRRANEQREASLEATEAVLRDVVVSMIAEVGSTYLQLRGDQERLAVARRNAENQRQTEKLTNDLLKGGKVTELDTSLATSQLNTTLAAIPPLEAMVQYGIFRLSVLLGRQPRELEAELLTPSGMPKYPGVIAIGNPQSLLQRRPDIRAAERRLAAATAQVGVATADLYPRVTFVGSFGFNASSPRDFGSQSENYSFGPGFTWAAFDLGRVRAVLRAADANAEATLAEFESTVLRALEETERAFTRFDAARRTRDYLSASAKASTKAAELANLRYRDGITDFITVLEAERGMLLAEDRLAQSNTEAATALIALYKSLGGGWEAFVDASDVAADVNSILP